MEKQEWIRETMELLEDMEKRRQEVQFEYDKLGNELADMQHAITTVQDLIRFYMAKHNVASVASTGLKPGSLANKSYHEMLVDIAKTSGGLLNVSDAIAMLIQSNIGTNKHQIQKNVYSNLSKSKHFARISRGNYRFINRIQTGTKVGVTLERTKHNEPSGVREAVRKLKEQNPQLTKKEVVSQLVSSGFDFKGKKPMFAVNMAWAYLGYHKEPKQQALPVIVEDKQGGHGNGSTDSTAGI